MRMTTTKYRAEATATGETFEFARSARSTEDKTFRFVWTLAPKKRGPGEHYHEDAVETFEIVSGTLRIWLDGEPKDYQPGDFVAIPAGVPHRFLNPGDEPVVVNVTLEGTRLEDTLVPIGVAVYGREAPRFGELLRMFVAIAKLRPSIPTSRLERTFFLSVAGMLEAFGVKPFEPVHGWDVEAPAAETMTRAA